MPFEGGGVGRERPEAEVCLLLGMALLTEGDTERAAKLFAQELENYPRNLRAAQALISVKDGMQDYQSILEVSSASLVHHPGRGALLLLSLPASVTDRCIALETRLSDLLIPNDPNSKSKKGRYVVSYETSQQLQIQSGAEAAGLEAQDWTAINGAYSESVADPDYLDSTTYMGAVNPDGSDPWWAGWTVSGSL